MTLPDKFVQAIDRKSQGYMCTYVVFDDYSIQSSLKDATRKLRTKGKSKQQPCYKVEDATPITVFGTLFSTKTKVQLVKCSCKKGECRGRCTCRQNDVDCTEFCVCEASYEYSVQTLHE